MKNIIIYFLSTCTFLIKAYEAPPGFCQSISGTCENHPFCKKNLHPDSPNYKRLEYDSFLRRDFVETINHFRQLFASGELQLTNLKSKPLPKASKMRAIVWDDELEWGANYYASQCVSYSDWKCAVTPTYRNVALFVDHSEANYWLDMIAKLSRFIAEIFEAYVYLDIEHINSYTTQLEDPSELKKNKDKKLLNYVGGEFPNVDYILPMEDLLHDDASKVGCATYMCDKNEYGQISYTTACILDTRNEEGKPIYKESMIPGSGCDEKNDERPGLCPSISTLPTTEFSLHITGPTRKTTTPINCDIVVELPTTIAPTFITEVTSSHVHLPKETSDIGIIVDLPEPSKPTDSQRITTVVFINETFTPPYDTSPPFTRTTCIPRPKKSGSPRNNSLKILFVFIVLKFL